MNKQNVQIKGKLKSMRWTIGDSFSDLPVPVWQSACCLCMALCLRHSRPLRGRSWFSQTLFLRYSAEKNCRWGEEKFNKNTSCLGSNMVFHTRASHEKKKLYKRQTRHSKVLCRAEVMVALDFTQRANKQLAWQQISQMSSSHRLSKQSLLCSSRLSTSRCNTGVGECTVYIHNMTKRGISLSPVASASIWLMTVDFLLSFMHTRLSSTFI